MLSIQLVAEFLCSQHAADRTYLTRAEAGTGKHRAGF
jgi:hypothetical protein